MTAAAIRPLPAIPEHDEHPPTDAERLELMHQHNHDLLAAKLTLERELKQRATTIATLRRELTRAIEAPTVVSVAVVDGMLTVTLSTGAVLQRRARCVESHDSIEYGFQWMAIESISGTRAQIVDGVFADESSEPEHYVTAGMRIVAGMGVIA